MQHEPNINELAEFERQRKLTMTRRHFFGKAACGIGAAALGSMLNPDLFGAVAQAEGMHARAGILPALHHAAKAKRVIYLFMSGGPSQIDLFDHKPRLKELHGSELPKSVRNGQRITGMTSGQDSFPVVNPMFNFAQYGKSGQWFSDLLPYTQKIADEITVVKTVNTEAINHDPAITYIQTGSQQPGRPSMGAWLSYGIGTENDNLPGFCVMMSKSSNERPAQALFDRLWGAGFLPSEYQGVKFRSAGDPVLYLSNPPGVTPVSRRRMLDGLRKLNEIHAEQVADPEINARIAQYEMAYRMQTAVPDLTDTKQEPDSTFELYGEAARKPGTFAYNCLIARRLAERGTRFIQLFHRDWDQHGNLPKDIREQCRDVDQASAALVMDLKQRGMLDDTLVIWGGEFGRTVYCQGKLQPDNYGRDHHGRCFSVWMAGAGVKQGFSYGVTDDFCYNIVENPLHIHDLNATILHLLGIDHERLTFKYQGRDFRLTDVHGAVNHDILV